MKTDLEVEVEVDLRPLGKVIIFRDKHNLPIIYRYHKYHNSNRRVHLIMSTFQVSGTVEQLQQEIQPLDLVVFNVKRVNNIPVSMLLLLM